MHARYYDARLGRFVQADTVVPEAGNPQAFNRYSYAVGNPVKYSDPSGHRLSDPADPEHDPTIKHHHHVLWDSYPPDTYDVSWGGSRYSLYLHSLNLGLGIGQHNPNGSIDDRFNPFYRVDELTGEAHDVYHAYYLLAEDLYEPYGGVSNLWMLAWEACTTGCNNPLNYEDSSPAMRTDNPIIVQAQPLTLIDNTAMNLFLSNLPEHPGMSRDYIWNFEPLWLRTLVNMPEHKNALLVAQWSYLDMYRTYPNELGLPEWDFETYNPPPQ